MYATVLGSHKDYEEKQEKVIESDGALFYIERVEKAYWEWYLNRDLCEVRDWAMGSSSGKVVQVGERARAKALRQV